MAFAHVLSPIVPRDDIVSVVVNAGAVESVDAVLAWYDRVCVDVEPIYVVVCVVETPMWSGTVTTVYDIIALGRYGVLCDKTCRYVTHCGTPLPSLVIGTIRGVFARSDGGVDSLSAFEQRPRVACLKWDGELYTLLECTTAAISSCIDMYRSCERYGVVGGVVRAVTVTPAGNERGGDSDERVNEDSSSQ